MASHPVSISPESDVLTAAQEPLLPRVLLIDDERDFTALAEDILTQGGWQVTRAHSGYEALQLLSLTRFDAAILDLNMPLISGQETLERLRRLDPTLPVIILTAVADLETAVSCMQMGAYDYFTKPVDWQRLQLALRNASRVRLLEDEVQRLRSALQQRYGFGDIIGRSGPMRDVFDAVRRVAETDVTVLLQGESGTGKELVARAIHASSKRRNKPFVAVNCAAIPETLLESELFGHEKGAFTGAIARRLGRFEQANGGTLFLDEIGEMSPATQVKILRVLQERRFERVGGTRSVEVDVRIISATNKDLEEEVREGRFRQDLYYRICVYPIHLPPLRERQGDIPILVGHFIQRFNEKMPRHRQIRSVAHDAMRALEAYDWPGNVRELENVLERSMLNADDGVLRLHNLPPHLQRAFPEGRNSGAAISWKQALAHATEIPTLEEIEREALKLALKLTKNNVTAAASRLGIGRTTFYRKMRRYGLTDSPQ
ncbi:MAG: sigma-54-dependent Fis family transcriptional regulator [Calditrichaeota bacterium]|nr:sigma-54-dependent Fis family transcriptional regulator [Calditrichota bacterium]